MVSIFQMRDLLRKKGSMSEYDLARELSTTQAMVSMMGERLAEKNEARLELRGLACSKHCGCGSEERRYWTYVASGSPA